MTSSWNNPIVQQEIRSLQALGDDLEAPFQKAVEIILAAQGRVVCSGIGKSGHIAQKVAATLTSTGTSAFFLHPTDAAHGGVGAIRDGDVLLAFSRSGRAPELKELFSFASSAGVPIILVSENVSDSLAAIATVVLRLPIVEGGHAPTMSSIVQMAVGDAVAVTAGERKGTLEDAKITALGAKQAFQV